MSDRPVLGYETRGAPSGLRPWQYALCSCVAAVTVLVGMLLGLAWATEGPGLILAILASAGAATLAFRAVLWGFRVDAQVWHCGSAGPADRDNGGRSR